MTRPVDEGVVKFRLDHLPAPALSWSRLRDLDGWRTLLWRAGLVGHDPARYGGAGFGNASRRVAPDRAPRGKRRFVVTGTQTGHLARLAPEHYTVVVAVDAPANRVTARGPVAASSESMTHAAVYDADAAARWVFHAHDPVLWGAARKLRIPVTRASVPYGTPEMASEVGRLFRETDVTRGRVFAMGGHRDGIVSFGRTGEEAGAALFGALARAHALHAGRAEPPSG